MNKAGKLAVVDKLLPLLEAFGACRKKQTELRRAMKASACTHEERMQFVFDEEGDPSDHERAIPCYDSVNGRTPWCDACRQHDQFFSALMAERRSNKKRLLKIERLAVLYAEPEELEPEEPKALLEFIEREEAAERAAATPPAKRHTCADGQLGSAFCVACAEGGS